MDYWPHRMTYHTDISHSFFNINVLSISFAEISFFGFVNNKFIEFLKNSDKVSSQKTNASDKAHFPVKSYISEKSHSMETLQKNSIN